MQTPDEKPKSKKSRDGWKRLQRFILNPVIGGVVVILPIALFVALVRVIVNFVSNIISPMRGLINLPEETAIWVIDLISLAMILTGFFFLGLIVRTRFGSNFFKSLEETWLAPLPFYNIIRDTVQQFFGGKKIPFSQVVLVRVFSSETLMTGFVTDEINEDLFTVFVPTGPNPTNGFIFHVKRDQLTFVDTKPEDAMRTVIGVGTGSTILFNPHLELPINEPEPESN